MGLNDRTRFRKTYSFFRSEPVAININNSFVSSSIVVMSGDPNAQFLVLANTASLNAERAFTPGTGLLGTDAGANSTYTLGINDNVVATVSGTRFTGPVTALLAGLTGSLTGSTVQLGSFLSFGQNPSTTDYIRVPNGGGISGRRTDNTNVNIASLGADNVVRVGDTEATEVDITTKSNFDINFSGSQNNNPGVRISTGSSGPFIQVSLVAATAGVLRVSGNVGNIIAARAYDNSTNMSVLGVSGDSSFSDVLLGDSGDRGNFSLYNRAKVQIVLTVTGATEWVWDNATQHCFANAISGTSRVTFANQTTAPSVTVPEVIAFVSGNQFHLKNVAGGVFSALAPTRASIESSGRTLNPGEANDWYCLATTAFTSTLGTSGSLTGSVISVANFASAFTHTIRNDSGSVIWVSRPNHNEMVDFYFDPTPPSASWGTRPAGVKTFK